MITVPTINLSGGEGEKVKLPESIFGLKPNPRLLAQAVRVFLSNQRKALARTKTRGKVAKTTAKMYRQKGTGRARHGSYSAPIFVGGGVAFGPTGEQNYKLRLSKRLSRMALFGSLSEKAREHKISVLPITEKFKGKTKEAEKLLKKQAGAHERLLLVTGDKEKMVIRTFKNLERVTLTRPNQLNTYLILAHGRLCFTQNSLDELIQLFKAK
jgi:large subunit ribosomal protein L4